MPFNDAIRTDIEEEFSSAEKSNVKGIVVHKDGKNFVFFSFINI